MAKKPTVDDLKAQLAEQFGELKATRKKKNPWLASSKDGLNMAYGRTKELALQHLITGIEARKRSGQ